MKSGTYTPGVSELQKIAKDQMPEPDLKNLVHSDPELMKTFEDMRDFVADEPEAILRIGQCGKELMTRVVRAGWGDQYAIDPFIDLEHAIASHVIGDPLYDAIAVARRQARRFQAAQSVKARPVATQPAQIDQPKEMQRKVFDTAQIAELLEITVEHAARIASKMEGADKSSGTWVVPETSVHSYAVRQQGRKKRQAQAAATQRWVCARGHTTESLAKPTKCSQPGCRDVDFLPEA
jgi:hypothetical protein